MGRIWMTGSVGSTLDPDDFTATIEDVLENKKAGIKGYSDAVYGIMTNNPSVNKVLSPGQTYKIPKGYHPGNSIISVSNFEELTDGTAMSEDIAENKTAYVNGIRLVGTMPIVEAMDITLSQGASYSVPKGIHDGNGIIRTNEATNQTPGTAVSGDILINKTAWVNGIQIMGGMTDVQPIDTITNVNIKDDDILFGITNGAHIKNTENGTPEARTSISSVLEALGITADIIKKDTVIGNMTGTLDYVVRETGVLYNLGDNVSNFVPSSPEILGTNSISFLSYEPEYIEAPFDLTPYNTLKISGFMLDTDDAAARALVFGFTNQSGVYSDIATVNIEEDELFKEFTISIDVSYLMMKNRFKIAVNNMKALIYKIKLN